MRGEIVTLRRVALELSVFALACLFSNGAAAEEPALVWRWPEGVHRRFFVESEVAVPSPVWFVADRNREARVIAWQLRLVLDCSLKFRERRANELACVVEDVGLLAAAVPGDGDSVWAGPVLPEILAEVDQKLTGAVLQLEQTPWGRIRNVDLEGLDRGNRRTGQMNETLRMLLLRAVAGLDLQLPKGGVTTDKVWTQRESLLMKAPNQSGSFGGEESLHQVFQEVDTRRVIRSVGRGMVVPMSGSSDETLNLYDSRLESAAVFDVASGALSERVWTVSGTPTASSAAAEGLSGLPYYQRGRLRMVGDALVDVGATGEVGPPGQTPTSLHSWSPLLP